MTNFHGIDDYKDNIPDISYKLLLYKNILK